MAQFRAASRPKISPGDTESSTREKSQAGDESDGLVRKAEHTSQADNVHPLAHPTRAEPLGCAEQQAKHQVASFRWEQTSKQAITTQSQPRRAAAEVVFGS